MKRIVPILAVFGAVLAWWSSSAVAKEETIHRDALPGSVRDALDTRYPGATLRALTHEREGGVDLYEAEMTIAGRHVDALFEASGRLREEEAVIPAGELPAAVRDSLLSSAQGGWKLERVERIRTADVGAAPRYELLVVEGNLRIELRYRADGRRLSAAKADPGD